MLNTKFIIYSFHKSIKHIKFFLIIWKKNLDELCIKYNSVGFYSKTKNLTLNSIYHYRLNLLFFIFLAATLYHFFFLSLTNQNVLCLVYLTLGAMLYLLFSGFIYFLKLYSYNRFTGFIQDFWRLSLTVFWLIEGSLLLVILFALSLGPLLPHHLYRSEVKLGCEYIQYISFESFIIKHLPLIFLVILTTKDDDEKTTFESIIVVIIASLLITWVLLDEFYLLFHITNVFMRETPVYLWGSKKWIMSHAVLWRTKMWASYFGICTFTKFIHVIFAAYFILFWVTSTLKEGGVASENDNVEEASDENIKAAANFNLVALYIWLGYMVFYPLFNRTVFVFLYNSTDLSSYYSIVTTIIKETILLFL